MRKRVLERIKEQGGPLFWADLKWDIGARKEAFQNCLQKHWRNWQNTGVSWGNSKLWPTGRKKR